MASSSEYANGPPGGSDLDPPSIPPPSDYSDLDRATPDPPFSNDAYRQNGGSSGRRTPDSAHRLRPTMSAGSNPATHSPGGPPSTNYDSDTTNARASNERVRSRNRGPGGRTASGQMRICNKCGEPLTGQFVRALNGTFHLDCFKCRVRRHAWQAAGGGRQRGRWRADPPTGSMHAYTHRRDC